MRSSLDERLVGGRSISLSSSAGSAILSLKNQALPSASSLTSAGLAGEVAVGLGRPRRTTGAKTSLAALTLSTTATASPCVDLAADLGHLDEHDVAELLCAWLRDADGADAAVDADPFVVLGEALDGHGSVLVSRFSVLRA